MPQVDIQIPELGDKFKDYRQDIPGDSFNIGPVLNAGTVKYLAFHHSVTPQNAKDNGNWKAECDLIANLHIPLYGGVGYRFIICSDGTVAYVGDLRTGGAAVRNHNDEIISVCMIGDFTKQLPTDAQIKSAHILAKHFFFNMPQYPALNGWEDMIGHKDASVIWSEPSFATACPGSSWPNDMKWRIETGTVYTPPTPPAPVPVPPPIVNPTEPELKKRIKELELAIETLKIDMRVKLAEKDEDCLRLLEDKKRLIKNFVDSV